MITLDGLFGLILAVLLFAQPSSLLTVLCGACGGMLPDSLRFLHRLYPHGPLPALQRFHVRIHSKQKLAWPIGIASQVSFNVIVIVLALEFAGGLSHIASS